MSICSTKYVYLERSKCTLNAGNFPINSPYSMAMTAKLARANYRKSIQRLSMTGIDVHDVLAFMHNQSGCQLHTAYKM